MTTEEKAKAYDIALERAKEWITEREQLICPREIVESIFPQLRESEDERIRRTLAEYFGPETQLDLVRGVPIQKIRAWLEKQKDASKAIEAVDRIDKYIDEHVANAHDMKDSNPDKKYYRGWDDALGKMAGILQDVYSNEKQKEQKQEIISISEMVSKYRNTDEYDDDGNYKGKPVNCMIRAYEQGIRDTLSKVKEQKPAWSEEDKTIIEGACNALKIYGHTKLTNRLKSLRPQPSWKPNKEQIDAIVEALKYLPNNKDEWMILNTLADILMKLI